MTDLEHLSDDDVAEEILTWAGRLAAGEARMLTLIREYDRRQAWAGVGVLSCAHWLSWQLSMGLRAAHERVRVARALGELPQTMSAFMEGRLSWTQVRAITRVADPTDEQTYVELARHATGAQLERLVRGVRRARKIVEDEADPELAAHRMRTRVSYDSDGTMVLSMRLPAEQGAVMLAALEQARAEVDLRAKECSAEHSPPGDDSADDRPAPASMVDGMLHLAQTFLATTAAHRPDLGRRHRARLVAHVDPLSGWLRLHDGELLPPPYLTRHNLGRTAREPSLALREMLGTVDGERCRFPGCTRHRRLHAHHVVYWSAGGTTDLGNLVLVCSRHHTLIHGQGFHLSLRPDRTLTVDTADGVRVAHHRPQPWQPAEDLDPGGVIASTTLPPTITGQKLNLGYAVAVLMQQAA